MAKRLIEIGAAMKSVYGKAIVKELLPYLRKFVEQNDEGKNLVGRKIMKNVER